MSATTMPFDANNAEGTAIVQLLLQRQDRLENRIDQHFATLNERMAAIERNQRPPTMGQQHEVAAGTMVWFALLAVLAISVIVGLIFVGGGGLGGG